MAETQTYPVLSRIRYSGTVYAPGTDTAEIALTETEAKRFQALGCVGDASGDAPDAADAPDAPELSLAGALGLLIEDGTKVADLNMQDLKKALGPAGKGIKREDVDAALADIEKGRAG